MIPALNTPMILEAPMRVADGIGGHRVEWTALGTLWAHLRAASGRETRGQVGPVSVVTWAITLRGAPPGDPRRPLAGQRLRLGARCFRIEAVAEADPAGRSLTCHAVEESGA